MTKLTDEVLLDLSAAQKEMQAQWKNREYRAKHGKITPAILKKAKKFFTTESGREYLTRLVEETNANEQ